MMMSFVVIVMHDDVVGLLVEGFSKKGALRLGLFFLWPPGQAAVCVHKESLWGRHCNMCIHVFISYS